MENNTEELREPILVITGGHWGINPELTSVEKGNELENEFALFLKEKLGWAHTRTKAHLPGKQNRKGAEIDIIARRLDRTGIEYKKLFRWYIGICSVFFLSGMYLGFFTEDNSTSAIICIVSSVAFFIGGVLFYWFSLDRNTECAWVECKNRKTKTTISHVNKSVCELKDYKASGDKDYRFNTHYFVSANGYMENALKYALENGIICYEKKDGHFVVSQYWK